MMTLNMSCINIKRILKMRFIDTKRLKKESNCGSFDDKPVNDRKSRRTADERFHVFSQKQTRWQKRTFSGRLTEFSSDRSWLPFLFLKPLRASICPSSSAHGALTVVKSSSGPAVFPPRCSLIGPLRLTAGASPVPIGYAWKKDVTSDLTSRQTVGGKLNWLLFWRNDIFPGTPVLSRCIAAWRYFYHQTPFKISLFLQAKYWGVCLVR